MNKQINISFFTHIIREYDKIIKQINKSNIQLAQGELQHQ